MKPTQALLKLAPLLLTFIGPLLVQPCHAGPEPFVPVVVQPLVANVTRLAAALDFLGPSLPADAKSTLAEAARKPYAKRVEQTLDARALFVVELNPEGS